MKLSNSKGDNALTRQLSPPSETSNIRNGLHLVEIGQRGPMENPQTSQAIATVIRCVPKVFGKALLLTTPTNLVEHRCQGGA